jgi:hypothetical protein
MMILRTPFKGVGKTEPPKGDLTGYWSRRIDKEHRLAYFDEADTLTVIACRFHYGLHRQSECRPARPDCCYPTSAQETLRRT